MNLTNKILSFLDDGEVIEITREMVAIPSITGNEGDGMLKYLKKWFDDLGIPVRTYPHQENRADFFADYGAVTGVERYLFNGHQDTKPVTGMTIDPFAGEIRDGRMYGRGACDMKGGIAAVLCAFKAMVRAGVKPKGGITFYADIEEELAGPCAFGNAIEKGLLDGFAGLISAEPSEMQIHIGNRGGYVTAFETRGRSAHSGLAHLGVNAVHNMCLFIGEFLKLPYLQVESPYFSKPTVNFEKIEGGLYLSAVPDKCIVCLDSRLVPETPWRDVKTQIDSLMDRLNHEKGINIREIDPPQSWRPYRDYMDASYIEPNHPLVLLARKANMNALGTEAVIGGCPAATLAGVMIRRGTPSIIIGPGSIAQAHTDDEWVEVEQIRKAARVYAAMMAEM